MTDARSTRWACADVTAGAARAGRSTRPVAARGPRRACPTASAIENVVVLGMGGSGIAGDVARRRRRAVPAGAGRRVEGLRAAGLRRRGLARVRHLVLGQHRGDGRGGDGGRGRGRPHGRRHRRAASSAELAESWGVPWIARARRHPAARAPGSARWRSRRSSCSRRSGCSPARRQWIDVAVDQLRERRDELAGDDSRRRASWPARIGRTIPLIYGGGAIGAAAAAALEDRRSTRTPRRPAFWNAHPELCHNECPGWGQHGDVTRQVFTLVNLRHDFEHPQVARRFELVEPTMLDEVVAGVEEVRAEGEGELAQLLDLVLFGDFVVAAPGGAGGRRPGPDPRPRRRSRQRARRRRHGDRSG